MAATGHRYFASREQLKDRVRIRVGWVWRNAVFPDQAMDKLQRLQEFWVGQIRLRQVIFKDCSVIGIPKRSKTEIEVRDAEAEPFGWSFARGQTLGNRKKIIQVQSFDGRAMPASLNTLVL